MSYHVIQRRRGLGTYCNDLGCFDFDRAKGAYVNGDGKTEDELRAPVRSTSAGPQYVAGSQGGTNPFLMADPSGTNLFGGSVSYNPNFYATEAAAQQFAAALGGEVVPDPMASTITGSPMWAIKLPNGGTVNAGALGQILQNPTDNENVRSGEIAKLVGATYQPGFAEALRTGSRINNLYSASEQAAGYNVAPWSGGAFKGASAPAPTAKTPAATTPAGQVVTSSNSAATVLNQVDSAAVASGIPWWGWALAAGAAVFMFSGRAH